MCHWTLDHWKLGLSRYERETLPEELPSLCRASSGHNTIWARETPCIRKTLVGAIQRNAYKNHIPCQLDNIQLLAITIWKQATGCCVSMIEKVMGRIEIRWTFYVLQRFEGFLYVAWGYCFAVCLDEFVESWKKRFFTVWWFPCRWFFAWQRLSIIIDFCPLRLFPSPSNMAIGDPHWYTHSCKASISQFNTNTIATFWC